MSEVTTESIEPKDATEGETEERVKIPLFGARKMAKDLTSRVSELEGELKRLGAMDIVELEGLKESLNEQIEAQRLQMEAERVETIARTTREAKEAKASIESEMTQMRTDSAGLSAKLEDLKLRVVTTEETAVLQEIGLYEYRHPLDDAVAYQAEIKMIKDRMKAMAKKDGGAINSITDWQVNGSAVEGRKMVRQTSKLVLRAYNAEADNLVRGMKPYKLDTSIERLNKVVKTISKLGQTMDISISSHYHLLRIQELELTADFINKKAEEKEREKEERARLREEQKVQQAMEREKKRLEKEKTHHENALAKLIANADMEAASRLQAELEEIQKAIEDVDYRAANIRAGYVYVISNIGTFGDEVVKVGLTRRLDPMDRVRELGDASVPFKFDVHALFFSDDAVGVERELHERLAEKRVNRVNLRREFFYTTPGEVKALLLDVAGDILEYEDEPEAVEYRQSLTIAAKPVNS